MNHGGRRERTDRIGIAQLRFQFQQGQIDVTDRVLVPVTFLQKIKANHNRDVVGAVLRIPFLVPLAMVRNMSTGQHMLPADEESRSKKIVPTLGVTIQPNHVRKIRFNFQTHVK